MQISIRFQPWPNVAQLVGASSCYQKDVGSVPGQGTYLGCRFNSWSGCVRSPVLVDIGGNQLMIPLMSMFLFLPASLFKSNEKMSLGEDNKTKN